MSGQISHTDNARKNSDHFKSPPLETLHTGSGNTVLQELHPFLQSDLTEKGRSSFFEVDFVDCIPQESDVNLLAQITAQIGSVECNCRAKYFEIQMHNEQVAPPNVQECHGDLYISRDLSPVNALEPPFGAIELDKGVAAGNAPSHVVTSHL